MQASKKRKSKEKAPATKKKRKKACDACHRGHKRCDGQNPCSTCTSRGIECKYTDRKALSYAHLHSEINKLKERLSDCEREKLDKELTYTILISNKTVMNNKKLRRGVYMRFFNMKNIMYSDVKLYLGSTMGNYLNVYFMTCYPHHYLCPDNFQDSMPDLLTDMVKEKFDNTENMFLLYAILANSTLIVHDSMRAEEFYHRALQMEEKMLNAPPSFVLGCAYVHMSYFCMCYMMYKEAYRYSYLARQICEKLQMCDTDLWAEALLKMAYTEPLYEERVKTFKQMASRNKLGDKMISILGLIHTELDYKQHPNYPKILDILYNCQYTKMTGWEFLYNLYVHALLLFSLRRAGLNKLALAMADKVLELASGTDYSMYMNNTFQGSELPYSCVVVSTFAMREVTRIHLEYGLYDKVDNDLRLIGTLAHYPITEHLFHEVCDKLHQLTQHQKPVKLYLDVNSVQSAEHPSQQRQHTSVSTVYHNPQEQVHEFNHLLKQESLESLIVS